MALKLIRIESYLICKIHEILLNTAKELEEKLISDKTFTVKIIGHLKNIIKLRKL